MENVIVSVFGYNVKTGDTFLKDLTKSSFSGNLISLVRFRAFYRDLFIKTFNRLEEKCQQLRN
jgi:hypothetical protein